MEKHYVRCAQKERQRMTNEEAIKQLLDAEHCLAGHGDLWDVDMEAFDMAIKALEQQESGDKE